MATEVVVSVVGEPTPSLTDRVISVTAEVQGANVNTAGVNTTARNAAVAAAGVPAVSGVRYARRHLVGGGREYQCVQRRVTSSEPVML